MMAQNSRANEIDFPAWRQRIRQDVTSNYHYCMAEGILRLEKNFDASFSHLKAALESDPRHILALGAMISLLESNNCMDEAKVWRQSAQQYFKNPDAEIALACGEDACASGDIDKAQSYLRQARSFSADAERCINLETKILLHNAAEFSNTGKIDTSINLYNEAGNLRPEWIEPKRLLARLLESTGRSDQVLDAWKAVLAISSGDSEANLQIGSLLRHQNRMAGEFRPYMQQAAESAPNNPYALEGLGFALMATGDPHMALAPLHKAVTLLPENPRTRYHYAVALCMAGQPAAGIGQIMEIEQLSGPKPVQDFTAAMAFLSLGQIGKAKSRIERHAPTPENALITYGQALLAMPGTALEANLDRWKELAASSTIPIPHLVLAALLDLAAQPEEAKKQFRIADEHRMGIIQRALLPDIKWLIKQG